MSRGRPVFRFAPSPNGRLHLGHAYSALLNQALAAQAEGRLLLRIEDIDPVRSRADFVQGILDDLAWLGISWAEPVRRQSEHLRTYAEAADSLRAGGLLYPCFCGRGGIARAAADRAALLGEPVRRDPDGAPLYPGTCRGLPPAETDALLAAGRRPAWRLDTGRARPAAPLRWIRFGPDGSQSEAVAEPERWGDPVIVRRDVPTSYHLAVVVDDAHQGVTHVVRGADLEAATDLHVLLQHLLGLGTPRYHHHALLRDEAGLKLAKSRGSPALADLRGEGVSPGEIRSRLGFAG